MPEVVQAPPREELIKECGRSIACIHAVEYYIKYIQNPCYPPDVRLTTKARKYLFTLMEKYGNPRCNIEKLVEEALRGTSLESLAGEAAALAVKIKKELNLSSRVAAAVAVIAVAWKRRIYVSRYYAARLFGVSVASVNDNKVRNALKYVY